MLRADWADAEAVHGDATTAEHLGRTAAQRRHDALVEMATRAMAAPADGKRPRPLVTVMVDYPTLAGRVCQLAGSGTVVAPGDIAALLGDDETLIERVVFDGPNKVVDISAARTFRGILRRIVELVHPRCDDETCFVPSQNAQGDHIVAWSQGGATSQDNGGRGCGWHSRLWHRRPDLRPLSHQIALAPPSAEPPHGDASGTGHGTPAHRRLRRPARQPDLQVTHDGATVTIHLHGADRPTDLRPATDVDPP